MALLKGNQSDDLTLKYLLQNNGGGGSADNGLPTGGTTGQVLSKKSNDDYDTEWTTPSAGSVTDVEVYGSSVVTDGVAEIPDTVHVGASAPTDAKTKIWLDTDVLKVHNGSSWVGMPPSGSGLPQGGNAGDVLTKASSTDYDAGWVTPYRAEARTVSVTIPANSSTTSVTATVPSGYTFICWLTPGPVGWGGAIWYSSTTILEPSTDIWTTNSSGSARGVVCPYLIAYTG